MLKAPSKSGGAALHDTSTKSVSGIGLLEVLIAVLLISVGFLAVARMQVEGMRFSQSAYYRSQGYFMANEIIDRMRANLQGVAAGAYDDKSTDSSYAAPDCSTAVCTPVQIALKDLSEWRANLYPDNNARPALPSSDGTAASGEIISRGNNEFTIKLSWAEDDTVEELSIAFVAQDVGSGS